MTHVQSFGQLVLARVHAHTPARPFFLSGVSLYGLLPALAVLNLRQSSSSPTASTSAIAAASSLTAGDDGDLAAAKGSEMPGRLGGGVVAGLVVVSGALVVPEILRIAHL